MMTITDFKATAEMTHDNKETAMKNWSKSWGIDYWRNLWRYKEYTSTRHGVKYQYRTGQVVVRHGHYSQTEFLIDGHEVSKADFLKSYNDFYYYWDVVRPKLLKVA